MSTRETPSVPELDLPRRSPRPPVKDSASSAEPVIELDLEPGATLHDSRPAPLRYCDVCGASVARYAVECPVCAAELGAEIPKAPTGAIVIAPKTALEQAIDPLTGRWAPLPSERPLVPASRDSGEPRGFWDEIALAPMGLWTRVIAYSIAMLLIGLIIFPCRATGWWAVGLLACAGVGVVGAVNRARADSRLPR